MMLIPTPRSVANGAFVVKEFGTSLASKKREALCALHRLRVVELTSIRSASEVCDRCWPAEMEAPAFDAFQGGVFSNINHDWNYRSYFGNPSLGQSNRLYRRMHQSVAIP